MLRTLIDRLRSSPSYWQTLANYTERVWGFAYSLILARIILPEVFGVFVFGMSIAQVASILTRWEIGNLVRSDKYYQNEGFDVVWALSKLLAYVEIAILAAVAAIFAMKGVQKEVWITILVCGMANAMDKLPLLLKCDLEGRSQFKQNLKVKLIFPPAAAAITIPLAMMGWGLWALLSSAWIGVAINWWVFRKANNREIATRKPSIKLFQKVVRPGLWQWVNYICYITLYRADKVVVGSVETRQSVGFYNRSYNYAPLSFMILGAIAGVPAVIAFRDQRDNRARWRVFFMRAAFLVGAGIVNGVIWLLWAEELVLFLFGENWIDAIPYFKAFAFFGAVQGIYFLSGSIMQGCKQYKAQALITLSSIAAGGACFIYVPISGMNVAVIVQSTMVLAAMGMMLFLSRRER